MKIANTITVATTLKNELIHNGVANEKFHIPLDEN